MADPNIPPVADDKSAVPPVAKPDTSAQDAEFAKKTKEIVDRFPQPVKDSLQKQGFPLDKPDTLTQAIAEDMFDKAIAQKKKDINGVISKPNFVANGKLNPLGLGEQSRLQQEKNKLESAKSDLIDHLQKKPEANTSTSNAPAKNPEDAKDKLSDKQKKIEAQQQAKINQLEKDIVAREGRAADHDAQLAQAMREAIPHPTVPDFYYFLLFFLVGKPSEEMKRLVEERFNIKLANLRELEELRKRLEGAKKFQDEAHLDKNKKNKPEDETTLTPSGKKNPDDKANVEFEVDPNNPKPKPEVEFEVDQNNPKPKPEVEFEVDQNNVDKAYNEIMKQMPVPNIQFTPEQLENAKNLMKNIEANPDLSIEERFEDFKNAIDNKNVAKIGMKPPVDSLLSTAAPAEMARLAAEEQAEKTAENQAQQQLSVGLKPR